MTLNEKNHESLTVFIFDTTEKLKIIVIDYNEQIIDYLKLKLLEDKTILVIIDYIDLVIDENYLFCLYVTLA